MDENRVTECVIGAAVEVHRALGAGLLESTYRTCLTHELRLRGLEVEAEVPLPLTYRDVRLECGYRLDLLVERQVIIELKAVRALDDLHAAQLLTYLKLSKKRIGLLINFNVPPPEARPPPVDLRPLFLIPLLASFPPLCSSVPSVPPWFSERSCSLALTSGTAPTPT
jgi:GxxExxY protein